MPGQIQRPAGLKPAFVEDQALDRQPAARQLLEPLQYRGGGQSPSPVAAEGQMRGEGALLAGDARFRKPLFEGVMEGRQLPPVADSQPENPGPVRCGEGAEAGQVNGERDVQAPYR